MKPFYLAGIPKSKRPLFVPDFMADSILDVDFHALKKLGIKHILIDLDLTLRKKMSWRLEPAIRSFLLSEVKKHNFVSLDIASNNMLNLSGYAASLRAKVYQPFWSGVRLVRKPNQLFYERIVSALHADPKTCVMIGDKLRGDVFGGNRAGMFTVMVKPKGSDYWYDRILLTRIRERQSLAKFLHLK